MFSWTETIWRLSVLFALAWVKNTSRAHPCLSVAFFLGAGNPHEQRSFLNNNGTQCHCWNTLLHKQQFICIFCSKLSQQQPHKFGHRTLNHPVYSHDLIKKTLESYVLVSITHIIPCSRNNRIKPSNLIISITHVNRYVERNLIYNKQINFTVLYVTDIKGSVVDNKTIVFHSVLQIPTLSILLLITGKCSKTDHTCFLLQGWIALMMEAASTSETSINFYQTTYLLKLIHYNKENK
jgi:hypothetical protein